MRSRRVAVAVLLVLGCAAGGAAGCARGPAPRDPTTRALYRDLERQVTVTAATGWDIDRLEIESMLAGTLDSMCRVDPLARRLLRAWVDGELRRLGAPVEAAWRARGKELSEVHDLLVLTRVSMLLARAEEATSECPFWLEPEEPFRGRQISERRWQVSFGGGGKGIAVSQGDRLDLRFGGAGRLLLGRTFEGGDGIYLGAELGATASFPKNDQGERTSLEIGADLVTPVVYRRMLTNSFFEVAAGWLGHSTEDDWTDFDHGVHVGFAFGARALRTRFVFPGAALGISYERTFVEGEDVNTLKLGVRVTFDFDL